AARSIRRSPRRAGGGATCTCSTGPPRHADIARTCSTARTAYISRASGATAGLASSSTRSISGSADESRGRAAFPTFRRGRQAPELRGCGRGELGADRPVVLERAHLRRVARDRRLLARLVRVGRRAHGRGPQTTTEQGRDAPREHPGNVLVARVLVAPPRG